MRLSRNETTWVIWSAVLAAMPFFAENISFAPYMTPMPGQPNMLALAIVLLAALLLRGACSSHGAEAPKVSRALGFAGVIATVVLVVVEMLLGMNRGRPYLDETQAALYQLLMPLEIICSVLAVLGWVVWSRLLGESSARVASRGVVLSFALGFVWCCSGALLGWLQLPAGLSAAPFLASGVLALAVVGGAIRNGGVGQGVALSFVMGWLASLCIKTIALSGGVTHSSGARVAAAGLVGAVFVILLVKQRSLCKRRASDHESMAGVRENCHEEQIKAQLSSLATKPLTGRESEILVRTVLGEPAGSIAEVLGIAEATVASYRRRGYQKLGVSGANQLRDLVAEPFSNKSTDKDGEKPPATGDTRQGWAMAGLLVLLVVALVGPRVLAAFLTASLGSASLVSLSVVVVLLAASLVRVASDGSAEHAGEMPAARVSLGEAAFSAACAALLAVQLHSLWMGYRGLGVELIALIVLPPWSAVCSRSAAERATASALRRGVGDFLEGFAHVYLSGPTTGCFIAMLAISDGVARAFFPEYCMVYQPMAAGATLLINAISLYLVVMGVREKADATVQLSESHEERALHYLRGRGLGELQARVMLDLVCGHDVGGVAQSRFTTVATVRSYRRRSLDALGLNNIDELRKLLSTEAGFTPKREVHHVK